MVNVCCVNGCRSESYDKCGISFHRFPKNEVLRAKWVQALGGKVTCKYPLVCSLHFSREDFKPTILARLTDNAVPHIATPAKKLAILSETIYQDQCISNEGYNTEELHVPIKTQEVGVQTITFSTPREKELKMIIKCYRQKLKRRDAKIKHLKSFLGKRKCNNCGEGQKVKIKSGPSFTYSNVSKVMHNVGPNKFKYDSNDTDSDSDDVHYKSEDDDLKSDDEFYEQAGKMASNVLRCKCCLGSGNLKSMWRGQSSQLHDYGTMLVQCFALPWKIPKDPLSKEHICKSCIERLKNAVNFKKEVIASEQLLGSHLKAGDLNKDEERDDEDTKFDVTTEYLNYDCLDDNNKSDDGEDASDDNNDECNKYNVSEEIDINNSTPQAFRKVDAEDRSPAVPCRKRKLPADNLKAKTAVPSLGISSGKIDPRSTEDTTTMNNKIKGYLEDVLRYSNATPIGTITKNRFKCSFCEDQYDSPKDLKHHTLDKHADQVNVKSTEHHVKLDITDLQCLDCYVGAESVADFVNHMKLEHNILMRNSIHYPIVPFKFGSKDPTCALCVEKFNSFDSLNKHTILHLGNYKITEVEVKFESNKNDMQNNTDTGSKDEFDIPEKQKRSLIEITSKQSKKCLYCGLAFKNQTAILIHLNKHRLKLPEMCWYCEAKFDNRKDLATHVKMKHNDINS